VIASRFEALGMTAEEAESRAALITGVTEAFEEGLRAEPTWRWFVPGRIEVFGKHTDYAGGRSLLAAVPRGFAVAASPRDDNRVRVVDVRYGVRVEIDPADDATTHCGWASYVQVVARRLAANFPGAPLGVDLTIASDLPRSAGLSSSSALVVAVATALERRAHLSSRPEWQAEIVGLADLAWYLGSVENGLDYRGLPGTSGVGTYGGSEDHTAILACRPGVLSMYRFVPVAHQRDVSMPDDWTFVVASSGVHADKAGSVKDLYNRASLSSRALLECWNTAALSPAHSLGAALATPDDCSRLRSLVVQGAPVGGFGVEDLLRRLEHFVAEDARVPEAARAFERADAAALARLSADSQRQADEWLGNQIPETRTLAMLARDLGATGASSFGAGFGGSVWAVVERRDAPAFLAAWREGYLRRFPALTNAEWFVARPGPALTEIRLEA
jgi:galactokinase